MKALFIEAGVEEFNLPKSIISKLPETVALATTVQFVQNIEDIRQDIEKSGREVVLYQGKKSKHPGQILGCDVEPIEETAEAILYIGDGLFHPRMLLMKNNIPVYAYDPFKEKFDRLEKSDIDRTIKRKKGAYMKFMEGQNIGIMISVKYGQFHQNAKSKLKEKYPGKKFYSFVADTFDFNQLENFPFIDCWVNTACPRIGYDDNDVLQKTIVNIDDLLDREEEAPAVDEEQDDAESVSEDLETY